MAAGRSLLELIEHYSDERSAHQYLAGQRWDGGEISCPHAGCHHNQCYVFQDGIRYKCRQCRRLFSAKTGTFMHSSKLPTIKWLLAWHLLLHKKGISSVQLAKDTGVTQKTAWFMLQRIRQGMGQDTKGELLAGTVEIDETFIGGKNKNRHYQKRMHYRELSGRTYPDKTTVLGLYCRETGRVKAMVLSRQAFNRMVRVIALHVVPGSTLMTDEWSGYSGAQVHYRRRSIDHSRWIYAHGEVTTNHLENMWSHLKRGLNAIYMHVTPKHLDRYVQECAFRINYHTFTISQQMDLLAKNMECRLRFTDLTAA